VTIGLLQMQASEEPAENVQRTMVRIREAAAQGAQIICLQELFTSRYFCQTEDTNHFRFAEPMSGPSTTRLGQLAAELQVVLIVPFFEERARGLYHNTAVIFDGIQRRRPGASQ
jgi:N-carbamoylputrescine amidase